MSDEVKLLPCRACGERCRAERFEGDQIDGAMTLYICANNRKLGGLCPDQNGYLSPTAWNTRPPIGTDEVVAGAYKRGWAEGCETLIEDYPDAIAPHKDAMGEGCGNFMAEHYAAMKDAASD